ncbi:MAG: signal peptidase II [Devosia sp.]
MITRPYLLASFLTGLAAFAVDRVHKLIQVSADCIGASPMICLDYPTSYVPIESFGWRGGEILRVTDFFDYVLVWNRGVSYGLLDGLPVWALGGIAIVAIAALLVWWSRSADPLVRFGLMLAVGGAVSNALDRALYGAVADFFHFYWQGWSFFIFNLADVAITSGVLLLLLDFTGIGRPKRS